MIVKKIDDVVCVLVLVLLRVGALSHHTIKAESLINAPAKTKNKDSVSRERHVLSAIPDSQGQERICLLFLVIY